MAELMPKLLVVRDQWLVNTKRKMNENYIEKLLEGFLVVSG